MQIEILQLLDGARNAKGLTVIIDVFRAFSVACYIAEKSPERIMPVGNLDEAYALKKLHPDWVLIGERNERKAPGFDFGNSPTHIRNFDFAKKSVVHTTSSGTQGIANATHADEIITGAFVNAKAIARYIIKKNPAHVSLVCMGYATLYPTDEDTFCAEYIKSLLLGNPTNLDQMFETIRNGSGARLFDVQNQEHSPSSDFYMCTDANKFDFILKVEKNMQGLNELIKVMV
jgi:2-phosphosulfolactate phosphatase